MTPHVMSLPSVMVVGMYRIRPLLDTGVQTKKKTWQFLQLSGFLIQSINQAMANYLLDNKIKVSLQLKFLKDKLITYLLDLRISSILKEN
jgi:hypothetical protein